MLRNHGVAVPSQDENLRRLRMVYVFSVSQAHLLDLNSVLAETPEIFVLLGCSKSPVPSTAFLADAPGFARSCIAMHDASASGPVKAMADL